MKLDILHNKLNFKLGFDRTIFFSDSVFAIAITLMAMDLKINGINRGLTNTELINAIKLISGNIFSFVISFCVIGYYWYIHHKMYRFINKVDDKLILMNFILLFFIIIIPFTTSLIGTHPNEISTLIYSVNITVISYLHFFMWKYATRKKYYPDYDENEKVEIENYINRISFKGLINPILLTFLTFVIIFDFNYLQYLWFIIILVNWVFDYSYNKHIFSKYN